MKGTGGHVGGPSITREVNAGYVVSVVTDGGATMPAFGESGFADPLSAENIRDIVVYLRENLTRAE